MSEEQDAAIVARVLDGDVDAFAGIVRRWQGPLVTLAFRFCRDRDRAEDMAQKAFVKVYRSLEKWRGDSAFSSWLFAVAVNVYRSEMRRARVPPLPLEAVGDVVDKGANAEGDDRSQWEDRVRAAVTLLPPRYRDVVVLFYFHDMNVRETAVTLAVAEGTVKARLHRGREYLRRVLGMGQEAPESGGCRDE